MNAKDLAATPPTQRGVICDIAALLNATVVTDGDGCAVDLGAGVTWVLQESRRAHAAGCKLIFLGSGADAGSASHMAIDFSKNGGVRALSMTDPAAITCLSNDLGFENVFAKQLEFHARTGDMVIIIGGSGTASVLLNGAQTARELGLRLVTTTTAPADNSLRTLGNLNFNIATKPGILATITQLALCHSFVDFLCGWTPRNITCNAL
jgi:D-sedoheptulose 7-phosphate isomerase